MLPGAPPLCPHLLSLTSPLAPPDLLIHRSPLDVPDGFLYLALSRASSSNSVFLEVEGDWPDIECLIGGDGFAAR